jgi:hypothetical protein
MNRFILPVAIAAISACGSLPNVGNGVVALQLFSPDTLPLASAHIVTIGQADSLRAVALDIHGDTVAAQIRWRTPDTAFVTLDSVRGILVGKSVGSARVQASAGTLSSDVLMFTVDSASTTGIRGKP